MNHLPKSKQEELELLTEQLSAHKLVEMVILFGSYARGNWVEDQYVEKGITYEYRSDFDILVVITHEDLKQKFRIEDKIKAELIATGKGYYTCKLDLSWYKATERLFDHGQLLF